MGDFWELEDDDAPIATDGSFEMGGGDFEIIPAKTQALAVIESIKIDSYEGDSFINATWNILKPDAYKGRKVFQKIRVYDKEAKKRDKAKRMLAAIDANAGGKLLQRGGQPTNETLTAALCNKPMMIMIMTWEQNDKKGNWVSAVSPKDAAKPTATPEKPVNFDDDIPW